MHSEVLLHLKVINFTENRPLEDGRKAVRQLGTQRAVVLRQLDMCWNGKRAGRTNERGCRISGRDNAGRDTHTVSEAFAARVHEVVVCAQPAGCLWGSRSPRSAPGACTLCGCMSVCWAGRPFLSCPGGKNRTSPFFFFHQSWNSRHSWRCFQSSYSARVFLAAGEPPMCGAW